MLKIFKLLGISWIIICSSIEARWLSLVDASKKVYKELEIRPPAN